MGPTVSTTNSRSSRSRAGIAGIETGRGRSTTRTASLFSHRLRWPREGTSTRATQYCGARGYTPERLDARSDSSRYPAWNLTRYPDGYLNARAGWAESGAVVEQLLSLCRESGVSFRSGSLRELISRGSRVRGVVTSEADRIEADRVVVAAGAWTPGLLPWLSDVLWSTGHPVLHFQPDDPDSFRGDGFPPWAADISGSGWYGFPALPNGRVKVANHGPGTRAHPDGRGGCC